jgi:hypothetical protein
MRRHVRSWHLATEVKPPEFTVAVEGTADAEGRAACVAPDVNDPDRTQTGLAGCEIAAIPPDAASPIRIFRSGLGWRAIRLRAHAAMYAGNDLGSLPGNFANL